MKVPKNIQKLQPYVPGKDENETKREYGLNRVVKLASNENPLGPSPKALVAIGKKIGELSRYPDAGFFQLRQAFSEYYKVKPTQLSFGSGSDELIDLLIRVFVGSGESVLTSEGAFSLYKIRSQVSDREVIETPMTADYRFDLKAMAEILKKQSQNIRLVFIANPNNPTGTYVSEKEFSDFMAVAANYTDTLVVLDEAYCEFVRAKDYPDGVAAFHNYPNVVLLRTMSKVFGLAGLRVGAVVAQPEVIDYLDRSRTSFNVNSLAQVAAVAALEDKDFLKRSQDNNWQGLDFFYESLKSLELSYCPSEANFVFFDSGFAAAEVFERLLRRGVILRPTSGYGFSRHLRMSVGLAEENQFAIKALKEVCEELKG